MEMPLERVPPVEADHAADADIGAGNGPAHREILRDMRDPHLRDAMARIHRPHSSVTAVDENFRLGV